MNTAKCPRCKAENSFAEVSNYDMKRNGQHGVIMVCTECNYQKSRIQSFKKANVQMERNGGDKKYKYDYAPKNNGFLAPVMPLKPDNNSAC